MHKVHHGPGKIHTIPVANEVETVRQAQTSDNSQSNTSIPAHNFTPEQYKQILNLLSSKYPSANAVGTCFCSPTGLEDFLWILDTGATDHMYYSLKFFQSHKKISNALPIKLPTGDTAPIDAIGTVKLNSFITLTNVLFVPSFFC